MEKKRIAFLVRGLPGLGHVMPSFAIAEELKKQNFESYFITYSNGVLPIKSKFKYFEVSPPAKAKGRVPWMDTFELTREVLPLLEKIKPAAIVVDGEFDSIFLLHGLGYKTILITTPHYIDREFPPYSTYSKYMDSILSYVDVVIVHGFFENKKKHKKCIFVGPLVRKIFEKKTKAKNFVVVLKGFEDFKGIDEFVIKTGLHDIYKVEYLGSSYLKKDNSLLLSAKFIITPGGMSSLSEAAVMGKPAIILYPKNDLEKSKNAEFAEKLGFGFSFDINKLTKEDFYKTLRKIESLKIKPMKNGLEKAVSIVKEMLG